MTIRRSTGKPYDAPPRAWRVHFEDRGQDFLWWDVAADGRFFRVTECGPFLSRFWTGRRLRRATVKIGRKPELVDAVPGANGRFLNYRISRIEPRAVHALEAAE